MKKLKRGDYIYLDEENKNPSLVNQYLLCRDGVVEAYEYTDCSGYGSLTRIFLCEDVKHEAVSIIRQVYNDYNQEWVEEEMSFDSDSYVFLASLIRGEHNALGGTYMLVRDFTEQ